MNTTTGTKKKSVNININGSVATLIIDRPTQLNALSSSVLRELLNQLNWLNAQSNINGVIISGSGEKAFVAGADIKEMNQMTAKENSEFSKLGQQVTLAIERLKCPVIACVNGYALGGGCELALACDFIYATENASFAQPEVKLGLIPCFGGCVRLQRIVGVAKAKEMIFTGEQILAIEAYKLGLVSKVFFDKEEMLDSAKKFILKVSQNSSNAIAICKQIIREAEPITVEQGLELEAQGFLKACAHEHKLEGTRAFVEKRKALWDKAETQLVI